MDNVERRPESSRHGHRYQTSLRSIAHRRSHVVTGWCRCRPSCASMSSSNRNRPRSLLAAHTVPVYAFWRHRLALPVDRRDGQRRTALDAQHVDLSEWR